MTKIYMMEIRDLTNEAKELNAQAIEIKTFEKQAQKKIEILAENHISAIASCLNHQLDKGISINRLITRRSQVRVLPPQPSSRSYDLLFYFICSLV